MPVMPELKQPSYLHIFAVELGSRTKLQQRALLLRKLEGAGGAPVQLPELHWDTAVLDFEEDRIVWVRAADLGKNTPLQP